ncbi:hypothetical protein HKD37_13G037303 [Glycine soja]
MKLVSFNVRGLGGTARGKFIRKIIQKEEVQFICIQEKKRKKKKEVNGKPLRYYLWGDNDVGWVASPSIGHAGGLLCMCDSNYFLLKNEFGGRGYVGLEGLWKDKERDVVIINIYAPNDIEGRRRMWEELREKKTSSTITCWCLIGDFNCVKRAYERVGVAGEDENVAERDQFNAFIRDMELEDAPCVGRKFTWYRPNGRARSKLDRMMTTRDWFTMWPGSTQYILDRNIPDHCPIFVKNNCVDWGPKSFKVLDYWFSDKKFSKYVESWKAIRCEGWGACTKRKAKRIEKISKSVELGAFWKLGKKRITYFKPIELD